MIAAPAEAREHGDLHANQNSVLVRLREAAERHTALHAAHELLKRERQALTGERPDADPLDARPSAPWRSTTQSPKGGELETQALRRYACYGRPPEHQGAESHSTGGARRYPAPAVLDPAEDEEQSHS